MKRGFIGVALCAAVAAGVLSGCESSRQNHPAPWPPGKEFTEREEHMARLLHLHALKDLQEVAQHWASMGANGADRTSLRNALRLLEQARSSWPDGKCADLVATLTSATEQALAAAEKITHPPGDKDRLIICLTKLRDELRSCNTDTLCIGKALMNYLICIHGFKGPLEPQTPGGTSTGTAVPAGRAR